MELKRLKLKRTAYSTHLVESEEGTLVEWTPELQKAWDAWSAQSEEKDENSFENWFSEWNDEPDDADSIKSAMREAWEAGKQSMGM